MKLSGVLIGTDNPDRLKGYYTKLFGKPTWEMEGYFGWQFGEGGIAFGKHDKVKGENREPGRIIWNLEAEDVKAELEKLRRAGATVAREPYETSEGGGYIATLSDPDGNYFQLMSPMPSPESEEPERSTARA